MQRHAVTMNSYMKICLAKALAIAYLSSYLSSKSVAVT